MWSKYLGSIVAVFCASISDEIATPRSGEVGTLHVYMLLRLKLSCKGLYSTLLRTLISMDNLTIRPCI